MPPPNCERPMVDYSRLDEAVIQHLQEIARVKRALLEVAFVISDEHPAQASLLVRTVKGLTKSADRLLGDTLVD